MKPDRKLIIDGYYVLALAILWLLVAALVIIAENAGVL